MPRTKVTKAKSKGLVGEDGEEAHGSLAEAGAMVRTVSDVDAPARTAHSAAAVLTEAPAPPREASQGAGGVGENGAAKGPRVTPTSSASSTTSSPHESEEEDMLECRESLLLEGAPAEVSPADIYISY